MNTQRPDTDRALRHWFEDGPTQMSDRVVDGIEARIGRQPQRRAWRLQGRPFVNTYTRLAAAAAALLILGFVGWQLLPARTGFSAPPTATPMSPPSTSPTTSPTPGASDGPPTVDCEDHLSGCSGPLTRGSHGSAHFEPRLVHYEVPAGWTNSIDTPTIYKLDAPDGVTSILLWADVSIEDQTPSSCEPKAKEGGMSPSAESWVSYLTSRAGLITSEPRAVDFPGSHDVGGMSMDISMDPTWQQRCPEDAEPQVEFVAHIVPPSGVYGVSAAEKVRIVVFDTGSYGPHTVLIEVYGPPDDAAFASTMATAGSVMDTFVFGCGPGAGYGPCTGYPFASP